MENYEQKYKEALSRARVVNPGTEDYNIVTAIFPELKESEDERIRKEIIHYLDREITLSSFGGDIATFKRWIDWLEKQKPVLNEEDEKMIELLIKIFEVSYPNEFYKVNPINITDMKGIHSFEIINWLQSLKNKVLPNQRWSEKDETTFACLWGILNWVEKSNYWSTKNIRQYIDWLKSLKQRLNGTE